MGANNLMGRGRGQSPPRIPPSQKTPTPTEYRRSFGRARRADATRDTREGQRTDKNDVFSLLSCGAARLQKHTEDKQQDVWDDTTDPTAIKGSVAALDRPRRGPRVHRQIVGQMDRHTNNTNGCPDGYLTSYPVGYPVRCPVGYSVGYPV